MSEQELNLLTDVSRIESVDPRNFARHFSNYAGRGGKAKNAECAKGLQVCLQACPRTAIRTGDREGEGRRSLWRTEPPEL